SQGIERGLFPLRSTGVSTEPVRRAAEAFLAALDPAQREKTLFPVDDLEWRKWDNRHFYQRQGVGFDEMSPAQREAAFELLRQSLSAKGLKKSRDIMRLNGTLAELTNNFEEYGQWLYWITVMGQPSADEPWGWQLDGHHLVINYFVLGDQVVMSPVFMGSEPVRAVDGQFKGTVVLQDEQNKGLRLLKALHPAQREKAVLMRDKPGNNNLAEAYKDNLVLDYAGLPASEMNDEQRELLWDLVAEYVGNLREPHAQVRMEEVQQHAERTWFAWIGGDTDQDVYYYRIHSPVILIEFDHQRRVAPYRSREPSRDHIHTVVRTPNGNDYGKDLLRQHYQLHPHGHEHDHEHDHDH
ncbi:MAG: DUF3500 domain-containing protein, partial [Planctomycetota bacterium]